MDIQIDHKGFEYLWQIGKPYEYYGKKRLTNDGRLHARIVNKNELRINEFFMNIRGQGYGTHLLNHVLKCVATWKQFDQIECITGWLSPVDDIKRNSKFYKKFGFETIILDNKFYIRLDVLKKIKSIPLKSDNMWFDGSIFQQL